MLNKQISLSEESTLVEQVSNIIIEDLKKAIPGDRILPERSLAQKYNVSRRTAAAAVKALTERGLLERKVGRGTYVSGNINGDVISPCVLVNFVQSVSGYASMEKMFKVLNGKSELISSKYFHGNYSAAGDFLALIKIRMEKRKATDIVFVDEGLIPVMAENGIISPIDDLLQKSKALDVNAFNPHLLDAYTYKGKLYGIPQVYSTYAMFYNKDMFNEHKLPLPDSSWTWDDLNEAARKLTSSPGDDCPKTYGLAFAPANINSFMSFFYQNCLRGAEDRAFYLPEMKETAEFLYSMAYKEKTLLLYPGGLFGPNLSLCDIFQRGHIGVFLGQYRDFLELKDNPSFNWGVCELPYKKRKAVPVMCQGWAVASSCASREKSFKAIEALMARSITDIYCKDYSRLPAYGIKEDLYPEVFIKPLEYAVLTRKTFPPFIECHNVLVEELNLLLNGHASPDDFYRNVNECLKIQSKTKA